MTRPQALAAITLIAIALAGGLLAVSCSGTGGDAANDATTATAAEWTAEQKIAEGERLVGFAGCNDCHTPGALEGAPDRTRTLAGSELGWVGPWGTSYPSNLTPDPGTGLGSLSEEQIATILRTGVRPDGTSLLPPMPWPNMARLTDREMGALVAYLKSLPPVKHAKLPSLPPGVTPTGATVVFSPPGAWDAAKPAPAAADSAARF